MTDNEWMTVSEVSEKVNIPVETIRRYIRSHSVHLKVKKLGKKYYIHESSLTVIEQIRALYDRGKNVDEVEGNLSASGIPMTITVKNDDDESMTVHVADELKGIKKELQEQRQFNQTLLEKLEQQHVYYQQKFEELKYDREFVSSLRQSMQQRKLESAEHENKTNEQLQDIEKQLSEIQQKQNDNEVVKELSEQIAGLNKQFEQMQEMIKETATTQQEKKGFFSRLFNK